MTNLETILIWMSWCIRNYKAMDRYKDISLVPSTGKTSGICGTTGHNTRDHLISLMVSAVLFYGWKQRLWLRIFKFDFIISENIRVVFS